MLKRALPGLSGMRPFPLIRSGAFMAMLNHNRQPVLSELLRLRGGGSQRHQGGEAESKEKMAHGGSTVNCRAHKSIKRARCKSCFHS